MTVLRMDNVSINVEDLDAAIAFFVELGLELEGRMPIEGRWVDRIIALEDARTEIAMMRVPGGTGRIELTQFHRPAAIRPQPEHPSAHTLGMGRIMFAVDDIDDVIARLRTHGAELIGEVVEYEDQYRLCYLRGPEGILLALAQPLR